MISLAFFFVFDRIAEKFSKLIETDKVKKNCHFLPLFSAITIELNRTKSKMKILARVVLVDASGVP